MFRALFPFDSYQSPHNLRDGGVVSTDRGWVAWPPERDTPFGSVFNKAHMIEWCKDQPAFDDAESAIAFCRLAHGGTGG